MVLKNVLRRLRVWCSQTCQTAGMQFMPRPKAQLAMHTERRTGSWQLVAYIVQHDADKHIERYSEEVDDGGSALFRHILAAHFHHTWPEDADTRLKRTEG